MPEIGPREPLLPNRSVGKAERSLTRMGAFCPHMASAGTSSCYLQAQRLMIVHSSAHSRHHRFNSSRHIRRAIRVGMIVLCWLTLPVETRAENPAENGAAAQVGAMRVQRLVDDYLPRLGMSAFVEVIVVPRNELMMSVEPIEGEARFRLSVDESFLRELSADELSATVAHELGHVWIFTHHPYLQTEQLANQIAMRLVARETLEPVYDKLWKRLGVTGDMAAYLGSRPAALH